MESADNTKEYRALLISTYSRDRTREEAEASLQELADLTRTMGFTAVSLDPVPCSRAHPKFFIGSGKAEELTAKAEELSAEYLIFDDDLSPSQQRNLETHTGLCVIDRREVILQIFADRASTREAALQVSLARLEYSLPRLKRAWTHLSRQRGGSRGTRGEGETQLEVDRRIAVTRIAKTKRELKKVKSHRATQRKRRRSLPVPTGAVVGYTNAGKSSLLNALTNAEVLVEDKLFATLDPTTRTVRLPGGSDVLLTDTVGFIRKLPVDLIEAFSSTLEESLHADFLLLVIDASDKQLQEHYRTTMEVLHDLGSLDRPIIAVFNKIDLCSGDLTHLNSIKSKHPYWVAVSASRKTNIDQLEAMIEQVIYEPCPPLSLNLPSDRHDLLYYIKRHGRILTEEYGHQGITVTAQLPRQFTPKLREYLLQPIPSSNP